MMPGRSLATLHSKFSARFQVPISRSRSTVEREYPHRYPNLNRSGRIHSLINSKVLNWPKPSSSYHSFRQGFILYLMAAGVYLHIPFCKSRCSYCDFATDVYRTDEAVERYVAALCNEIEKCRSPHVS